VICQEIDPEKRECSDPIQAFLPNLIPIGFLEHRIDVQIVINDIFHRVAVIRNDGQAELRKILEYGRRPWAPGLIYTDILPLYGGTEATIVFWVKYSCKTCLSSSVSYECEIVDPA